MTDKSIKKGDEVTWNWGSGHPSGTVAEIKNHGSLEIVSKGKRVHKNADHDNPAVRVEREGNDVVKRASELTKESSVAPAEKKDKKTTAKEAKEARETKEAKEAKETKEAIAEKKEADAGEKRDRSEADVDGYGKSPTEEQLEAEKETGKEAKKPKLDENAKEKNGNGDSKKSEEADSGDAEKSPAPKKRGPGRPKKSEIEARKKEEAAKLETGAGGAEKISQRTRSKA